MDIEPSQRPSLPRVQKSDQLMKIINILNTQILPEHLHQDHNLQELQGYIYTGAITAATMIGAKVTTATIKHKLTNREKPWERCLTSKLNNIRKDLGQIMSANNPNNKKKTQERIENI
jgi:hypothetical protein